MTFKKLGLAAVVLAMFVAAGCGSVGTKAPGWAGLAPGDKITVLPLKDHVSEDPEDTVDTGIISQRAITNALSDELRGVNVDLHVPKSYDPALGFTKSEALAIGAERGSGYVLFGNCIEFFRVAPMTFRQDKGGVDVQILALPDGRQVYRMSRIHGVANTNTPEDAIEELAEAMAEELEVDD